MLNKKIYILLPDGIGLRNFAYTSFYSLGKEKGYDITFWNHSAFDLSKIGFDQIMIKDAQLHPLTILLKTAKQRIELNQNLKSSGDAVFSTYLFQLNFKGYKNVIKSALVSWFEFRYGSASGLRKLNRKLQQKERSTKYYCDCVKTLKAEKPAFIFCTNQRTSQAIAPLAAAKDLGIPTATFIFSWDNLPKATMVVETDYYFVWSEHMRDELLHYYPQITESRIRITGTPQFESHFTEELIVPKDDFFRAHNLDPSKKYICYSGDDIATSPDD
ncbi:MAG TPA: UDP-glycosyltransferase, partial [Flavobacterium sp.]